MENPQRNKSDVGFVVIGRNEGDRLKAGLNAIKTICPDSAVVYVDSGSTDDSVAYSRSLSIHVVELDMSVPFTAARARNAGFEQIIQREPTLTYVQFMDGDCELLPSWIDAATETLAENADIAIVSGRREERYPEASVYNTLMDIEWNTPIGETRAVLGDMCLKVNVFKQVGGFSEDIIAAEDDDMCIRVRAAGYKVFRIDASMSRHDANIMHLSQWYKRSKRGGHGYANINHLHGNGPDKYFRKELISVTVWGAAIPLAFITFLFVSPLASLILCLLYAAFIAKTTLRRIMKGDKLIIACAYGFLIFTGKTPEFFGAMEYWKNRLLSRKHQLIEYK